jgi:hypothetical protein
LYINRKKKENEANDCQRHLTNNSKTILPEKGKSCLNKS